MLKAQSWTLKFQSLFLEQSSKYRQKRPKIVKNPWDIVLGIVMLVLSWTTRLSSSKLNIKECLSNRAFCWGLVMQLWIECPIQREWKIAQWSNEIYWQIYYVWKVEWSSHIFYLWMLLLVCIYLVQPFPWSSNDVWSSNKPFCNANWWSALWHYRRSHTRVQSRKMGYLSRWTGKATHRKVLY